MTPGSRMSHIVCRQSREETSQVKSSFIAEYIPSGTDAGGIYNKSEANIRAKLIRLEKICTVLIYSHT